MQLVKTSRARSLKSASEGRLCSVTLQLQFARRGVACGDPPLAGIPHGGRSGHLDHIAFFHAGLADVADVQVSGEDDVHACLDKALAQLAGIIDHVGGCQCLLHVEVRHQVVVHHGDDSSAAGCRPGGLVH